MRNIALSLGLLLLLLVSTQGGGAERDAAAAWQNRCEECHGEADKFAQKYLWDADGTLQGQHHVDDLHLFMENHYLPSHEVDKLNQMLLGHANRLARFAEQCGSCHDSAEEFVRQSISTWGDAISGINNGIPVVEFLPTHQGLTEADAEFFTRLLTRVESQLSR